MSGKLLDIGQCAKASAFGAGVSNNVDDIGLRRALLRGNGYCIGQLVYVWGLDVGAVKSNSAQPRSSARILWQGVPLYRAGVAAGREPAGGARLGVEAAARQFGLDFIRLLTEDYFFVCKRAFLETGPMQRVLDIMKGGEFHGAIATLPGYIAANTGAAAP